jgi:hypothetical protein
MRWLGVLLVGVVGCRSGPCSRKPVTKTPLAKDTLKCTDRWGHATFADVETGDSTGACIVDEAQGVALCSSGDKVSTAKAYCSDGSANCGDTTGAGSCRLR